MGDRYHGTKHRHVTVQALDDLAVAAEALGRPIDPGLTRRNVTLDHGPIPTRPGERMRIGGVELEVVRIAAPCRLLDDWLGPGAMQALQLPARRHGVPAARLRDDPRRRRGRRPARVLHEPQQHAVGVDEVADPHPRVLDRRRVQPRPAEVRHGQARGHADVVQRIDVVDPQAAAGRVVAGSRPGSGKNSSISEPRSRISQPGALYVVANPIAA